MSEPSTVTVTRIEPDRYAIEIALRVDGQTVHYRYEAPTAEEVLRLADLHQAALEAPR